MTESKGFMRLNTDELRWLEGRIGTIEVQKGCPHQCIICAVDAPKYTGSMPWKDFMTVSDSVVEAKIKKRVDLWRFGRKYESEATIDAFWSSDPINYRAMDGDKERTIYDVLMNFHRNHSKKSTLTTAGWRPSNNYMQRAANNIVDAHMIDDKFGVYITYSIKTCMPKVMKEYDSYAKYSRNKDSQASEFFKNSKYVKNICDNLKTLLPIDSMRDRRHVFPSFQYIENNHMTDALFEKSYGQYNSLFSFGFMQSLADILVFQGLVALEPDGVDKNSFRSFGGVGRALNLGLPKDINLNNYERRVSQNSSSETMKNQYSAIVNGHGQLQICYGEPQDVAQILVPKEHFQILADKAFWPWQKKEYKMLAVLQGKRLLD